MSDIRRRVDLSRPFQVELIPNEAEDTVTSTSAPGFRQADAGGSAGRRGVVQARPWKCIVWDLDNTVWDGTLIEDGPAGVRIRPDIVAVIEETIGRGILHSIASKNNHADAMQVLRSCGLTDYFLHPQITWEPKSRSVARIAERLNIGVDALAFVDDPAFEREEVAASTPHVAVIDARDAARLQSRPECNVPITDEGRQRRVMYQAGSAAGARPRRLRG